MVNNNPLNNNEKSLLRNKRLLRAKQAKLARLLKSDIASKLGNIQGFTFHK